MWTTDGAAAQGDTDTLSSWISNIAGHTVITLTCESFQHLIFFPGARMKSQSKYYSNVKSPGNLDWVYWGIPVLCEDLQCSQFSLNFFKKIWMKKGTFSFEDMFFYFQHLSSIFPPCLNRFLFFLAFEFLISGTFGWKWIVKVFLATSEYVYLKYYKCTQTIDNY